MKAIKCQDGASIGPKRKKKGAIPMASSINFGDSGEGSSKPRSCNPDAPDNTASAGGSGITVNKGGSGNSRANQKAGTLSSKKQLNRSRVLTPKELERQREKNARQEKRDKARSMTRGEKKATEQKIKDQRYAGPRFL
jgi:hypothetical protein